MKAILEDRRDRTELLIDRILSFSKEEQLAFKSVQLFLSVLGFVQPNIPDYAPLEREDMHVLFAHFAVKMDWFGELYMLGEDGRCRAVTLFLSDDAEENGSPKKYWFCPPPSVYYTKAPWRLDEHQDKERLVRAVRGIFPIWRVMRDRTGR